MTLLFACANEDVPVPAEPEAAVPGNLAAPPVPEAQLESAASPGTRVALPAPEPQLAPDNPLGVGTPGFCAYPLPRDPWLRRLELEDR